MAWDQIHGHDRAKTLIFTAIQQGRLGHAYLFVGPDGVGKRRFALELAKSLLCEAPPSPLTACGRCPACQQVAAGTHPDFFTVRREEDDNELSIDSMREFCYRLGLKPSRGSRNIGIVEEADNMNASSANCFLKPLEEPPPGSLLILLATATDQLLPTILSRCQQIPFPPLSPQEMTAVLHDHGISDPQQVRRLIRHSHGSPGRALLLNDPLFWSVRQRLVVELAKERIDPTVLISECLGLIEAAGKSTTPQRECAGIILEQLLDLTRTLLRSSLAAESASAFSEKHLSGVDLEAEEQQLLAEAGQRISVENCLKWLDLILAARAQLARYIQIALVFENLFDQMFPPTVLRGHG